MKDLTSKLSPIFEELYKSRSITDTAVSSSHYLKGAADLIFEETRGKLIIDDCKYEHSDTEQFDRLFSECVNEKVIPLIDKYRLVKWVTAATTASNIKNEAVTTDNAYQEFIDARKEVFNATKGNLDRIVCFASSSFVAKIELDSRFKLVSDLGMKQNNRGLTGKATSIKFIEVPEGYLPASVNFVLADKDASSGPIKLTSFRIFDDWPGISGYVADYRIIYGLSVAKKTLDGVFVHKSTEH
ncbi:hypothetical protein CR969_00930 [Candidatus Saccharibacteria bacterium]|nr:MAG: hypothetical protein CR969_00930 [Candidatus Saccharibacteria bacterium]